MGRKFVIPIVVDDCSVRVSVANRIYSNFRDKPYQTALETLERTLSKGGAREVAVDPKYRIVPLVFTKGVYLNTQILIDSLNSIPKDHVFNLTQLVLGPDEDYAILRTKLQQAVDEVATWPEYTPRMEQYARSTYEHVKHFEKGLLTGVKQLLEHMRPYGFPEPSFWFCRIIRQDLLATLWGIQRQASADRTEYGKGEIAPLETDQKAARFFEVESVTRVQCFPRDNSGYFGAWIDGDSTTAKDLTEFVGSPEPLLSVCSPRIIHKFLIPQMLFSNLLTPTDPVSFDFKDYLVGLA